MIAKLTELLGSRRFWLLTLGALVLGLKLAGIVPDEVSTPILSWVVGIVGVGTLDKIACSCAK